MAKINTKKYDKYFSGQGSYYGGDNTLWGSSSFWLGKDFVKNLDTAKLDYMQLAGYKRAISNFVRIVTGKQDIAVHYSSGKQSYTDGKTVVISSKIDDKEFDSTVGLALHEGSHIALTDFKLSNAKLDLHSSHMIDLVASLAGPGTDLLTHAEISSQIKCIVNVIEDRRIDNFVYTTAPGYRGYYQTLYEKYFFSKEIDQALKENLKTDVCWDSYEFHIINLANPNRNLNALPRLKEIWDLISLPTIGRLTSTKEVIDLSIEVYKIIWSQIGNQIVANSVPQPQPSPDQQQSGGDNQGPSNEPQSGGDDNDDSMGGMDLNLDIPMTGTNTQESKSNSKPSTTAKFDKALQKAIQRQKDFMEGNIKKKSLLKKDADDINVISESNINYQDVQFEGQTVKCLVVKGLNRKILGLELVSNSVNIHREQLRRNDIKKDFVAAGIQLGKMLGKRLKTRDEEQSLKTTRMDSGRIDRRLVAELGFGNENVFSHIAHRTTTPAIIHITLDASGSMSGKLWFSAMKTAVAIAKAASMTQSLDCVISLRGTSAGANRNGHPLMWIVYDSRTDGFNVVQNYFRYLDANGSTPEGLCYDAVLKDIIQAAAGKDAFFINVSDGEPGFNGYHGDAAVLHTRNVINKITKSGIEVLSYFVSEHNPATYSRPSASQRRFRDMYGSKASFIDVNNLSLLSKTLNELFVAK